MRMTASSYPQHSILLNYFLICATMMPMTSPNSIISISLTKSETKHMFVCLSAFESCVPTVPHVSQTPIGHFPFYC